MLAKVAAVEAKSEHPIARAIVDAAEAEGLVIPAISGFESVTGFGVKAAADGERIEVRRRGDGSSTLSVVAG